MSHLSLEDYDLNELRRFIALFPSLPLSRTMSGYFHCKGLTLQTDPDSDEDTEEPVIDYDAAFQSVLVSSSEQTRRYLASHFPRSPIRRATMSVSSW